MPIYTWVREDKPEERVEVLRGFEDFDKQPTEAEYKKAGDYKWKRLIGKGINVTRAAGFGSKGNWLYLLAFLL